MTIHEFEKIQTEIRAFADARAWEKFQIPKNLAMAITGEAAKLVAEFQGVQPLNLNYQD